MKRPSRRVVLGVSVVLAILLGCIVVAGVWYANFLTKIHAKPIVTILNDTDGDMTDIYLVLIGSDFPTKEYHFPLLRPAQEVSVTVDASQEFSLKSLTFFVGQREYEVTGGQLVGPGEHPVLVVDNGLGVVWRSRPPTGVLRPIRVQGVPKTAHAEARDEGLP